MAARHVIIYAGLVVSGLLAGWVLRSYRMYDDYQLYAPIHRPAPVPSNAFWVGGADGGAYIRCYLNAEKGADECSVWNDFTGGLVESGQYMLTKEHRAATEDELIASWADFGGSIGLQNGLVLKRQSVNSQPLGR